jgi:hypothetical protein
MQQILILFFTFSGISAGFAQPEQKIISRDSLEHNRPLSSGKNDSTTKEKYFARLYPNPTRNKVLIDVKGFEPGYLQLKFYDAHGIKLRDEKRLLSNGNEVITVMFLLQPGMYMLLLKQGKKSVKKNLLVQ